jgi:hypothetical protein
LSTVGTNRALRCFVDAPVNRLFADPLHHGDLIDSHAAAAHAQATFTLRGAVMA